ncbi:hypothetical protein ACIBCA_25300 [Kitasatospora sp. NPDC051170]|uniref:hypothetical protein n=1 Tax=Kitasatospora sp. NPDC051170 TaxID=3364056 RepID=UPI0037B318FE
MQRGTLWWIAGVGGAATVALVLVALLTSQETTGLVSGVAGAVAGVVGAVAAVLALRAPAVTPTASSDRTVEARGGGVAAGGDINESGGGASSGHRNVSASGRGSVAAGGDINGIDLNRRSS